MAHTAQERYAKLVDAKLRNTLVTKDNLIFNNRYEGDPKAGKVKIPVRDTEVEVKDYDKASGIDASAGSTTYIDLNIDHDEAVNEIIDGFDAASVPDGIVAERLDSAGYSLGLSMDKASMDALQAPTDANISATKTATTASTAYKEALAAKRVLSRAGVPNEGRWMIASPEYLELLLQDTLFVKQGDLAQELVQAGAVGKIAGFTVFESNNMDFESTTRVASKKTTTEFICGHPNWCHRVQEWQVPVHVQDLSGSGKYIGASAVQGRKVYGLKVSKPKTLYIKRVETAVSG
ncbi:phage major capsid protein [Ruthenibacterium lactatiformans]|uniref:phage major capsid protein n=1 Tax=Ruthenibacterium lactatiformans TaxID=1550024 RepID=UPI003FD72207